MMRSIIAGREFCLANDFGSQVIWRLYFYFLSIEFSGFAKSVNGMAKGPKKTTINLRTKFDLRFLALAM